MDDASTSQGTAKVASKAPEARGEAGTDCPSQPSGGNNSADTLISDSELPKRRDNKFLFRATQFVVFCDGSSSKLIQY